MDTGALAAARESAEPHAVARALQSLSWSLALTGELDRAADGGAGGGVLLRDTTARSALARSLRTLGAIHAGRGERARALAAFTECRAIAEEINEAPRVLSCRRAIAAGWVGDGPGRGGGAGAAACLAAYREMGSHVVGGDHAAAAGRARTTRSATAPRRRRPVREADRIADPRDANAQALTSLLLNLTRVPSPSRPAPEVLNQLR